MDDARAAGAADRPEGRAVNRSARGAEVGVVEYVEKFATELQAKAFDNIEGFEQRVVQVPVPGSTQLRAPRAAESADRVRPKDGGVEPACDLVVLRAATPASILRPDSRR